MKKLTLILACLLVFTSIVPLCISAEDAAEPAYTATYATTKPSVYGDGWEWDTAWQVGTMTQMAKTHATNHGSSPAPTFKVLHDDTNLYILVRYEDKNGAVGSEVLALGLYGGDTLPCPDGCTLGDDGLCVNHKEIRFMGPASGAQSMSATAYQRGVGIHNLTSVGDGAEGFRYKSDNDAATGVSTFEIRIPKAYIGNVTDAIGIELAFSDAVSEEFAAANGIDTWDYENYSWAGETQRGAGSVKDPWHYGTIALEGKSTGYTAGYATIKPYTDGEDSDWNEGVELAWGVSAWATMNYSHVRSHGTTAAPKFKVAHDDANIYLLVVYEDTNGTLDNPTNNGTFGGESLVIGLYGEKCATGCDASCTTHKEIRVNSPASANGSASMSAWCTVRGAWKENLSSVGESAEGFRYKAIRKNDTIRYELRIPKAYIGNVGDTIGLGMQFADTAADGTYNYENFAWAAPADRTLAAIQDPAKYGIITLGEKAAYTAPYAVVTPYTDGVDSDWNMHAEYAWNVAEWGYVANTHEANHGSTEPPKFKIVHDADNIYLLVVYNDTNGTLNTENTDPIFGQESLAIGIYGDDKAAYKEIMLNSPAAADGSASMSSYINYKGVWVEGLISAGEDAEGYRYKAIRNGDEIRYELRIPKAFIGATGDTIGFELNFSDISAEGVWNYENYTWSSVTQRNMKSVQDPAGYGTVTFAAQKDHVIEAVEATDYTCTTDGNLAHWICTECGLCFADAEGTEIIAPETVVTPAAHTYDEIVCMVPTVCTVCGEEHTFEHDEITIEAVAPTCTTLGATEGTKCSRCDEILVAPEAIPTIDHTVAEGAELISDATHHWYICATCATPIAKAEHEGEGTCTSCGATIATGPVYSGDFDGNEKVDAADLQYLSNHLGRASRYPLPAGVTADYDKSGKVDAADLAYLSNHIGRPSRYPIPPKN